MVFFRGTGIMTLCKIPQLPPVPALFPGAVIPASEEQQASVIPEGHPCLRFIHIHPMHIGRVFKRGDVRAALIQLDKITAVLIQKGEMRRRDDFLCCDFPVIRKGFRPCELPDRRVLIDMEPF